jgi:hypothetical protein
MDRINRDSPLKKGEAGVSLRGMSLVEWAGPTAGETPPEPVVLAPL